MPWIARKRVEIERKLKSFDDELKRWTDLSRRGGDFPKHGSQIRAVKALLDRYRARVHSAVEQSADSPDELAVLAEMSRMTLALLGIWDYFRSKLEQRFDPAFQQPLGFADELAWACYEPVYVRGTKEPPLVFLNSSTSPFVLRRDVRFRAESLPRELVGSEDVTRATAHLPFPVIGVPWYQVDHLPDAVVIGHEVGHAVEADLKLADNVEAILVRALQKQPRIENRLSYWKHWRSELFADAYGSLATGPAFVGALGDFLAAPALAIRAEPPSLSDYPPVVVRMRFNAAILGSLGFAVEADTIWKCCQSAWEPFPARLAPYIEDAVLAASALVTERLPALKKQKLTTLLSFDHARLAKARELVVKARASQSLGAVSDLRILFAAVRLAYEAEPREYDQKPAGRSVLVRLTDAINAAIKDEYRAGEPKRSVADVKMRDDALAKAGERWFEEIRGAVSPPAGRSRGAP